MADINKLMSEPEFLAKLENVESLEEVAKICTEAGVAVTPEELKAAMAQPEAGEDGEIGEDALDAVSGGVGGAVAGIIALIKYLKKKGKYTLPVVPGGRGPYLAV